MSKPHLSAGPARVACLFALALSWSVPARAELTALGDDLQISPPSPTTSSNATTVRNRHVGTAADGSFVVVWQAGSDDPSLYGINLGVRARRFDADGTALTDTIAVNSYTTGPQALPGVASRADGSFVVVWQSSPDATTTGNDVFARLFDADGSALTEEFLVNSITSREQIMPSVDVFDDGSFVVVWHKGTIGSAADIAGRRFDSGGAPAGTEFVVNSYTTLDQRRPVVATTSNGFVVAWDSANTDGAQSAVMARRFEASGAGIGDDFIVNTYTTQDQLSADVAVAGDDSFVVVWASKGQDGSDNGVFGQRFAANATAAGTEFQISQTTSGTQEAPSVSYGGDGFAVAWVDIPAGAPLDSRVMTRCYDAAGQPTAGEAVVAQQRTLADGFSIDANPQGRFVVAWTGPPDVQFGAAVRARRYDRTTPPPECGNAALRVGPARVVTASDALFILRVAVGTETCELCVCDVDTSGSVSPTDALLVLKAAVMQPVTLMCPPCA